MPHIHLIVPISEVLNKIDVIINKLDAMKKDSRVTHSSIESFKNHIHDTIELIETSFNYHLEDLFEILKSSNIPGPSLGKSENSQAHQEDKINWAIGRLEYLKAVLSDSDVIYKDAKDLFDFRQTFTIKKKTDFVLSKFRDLGPIRVHSIGLIYVMYGLNPIIPDELEDVLIDLERLDRIVAYKRADGRFWEGKIKTAGLSFLEENYSQDRLNYNEGTLSNHQKEVIKYVIEETKDTLVSELKVQFEGNREHLIMVINALFQATEDSKEIVDSKISRSNLVMTLIGFFKEKAANAPGDFIWDRFVEELKKIIKEHGPVLLKTSQKFIEP